MKLQKRFGKLLLKEWYHVSEVVAVTFFIIKASYILKSFGTEFFQEFSRITNVNRTETTQSGFASTHYFGKYHLTLCAKFFYEIRGCEILIELNKQW